MEDSATPVLVIGPAEELANKLLALCQSAGYDAWHYDCFPYKQWQQAPSILVCQDTPLDVTSYDKRGGVALITTLEPDTCEGVYKQAIDIGAEAVFSLENALDDIVDFLHREHSPQTLGKIISVMSTSGNIGATTLALALSQAVSTTHQLKKCLLIDGHQYRSGLSKFVENCNVDWSNFASVQTGFSPHHLMNLPTIQGVPTLSWAKPLSHVQKISSKTMHSVIHTASTFFDYIILDQSAEYMDLTAERAIHLLLMRASSDETSIVQSLTEKIPQLHCILHGKLPSGIDKEFLETLVPLTSQIKYCKNLENLETSEAQEHLKAISKSVYPQCAQELVTKLEL